MKVNQKNVRQQRPTRGFWGWLFGSSVGGTGGKA